MQHDEILDQSSIESFDDSFPEKSALESMNREPGNFLEKFLDYADAEAIQAFFTTLVENLAGAFKGAFHDYLDAVNPEPEAFAAELEEPLKDMPVVEKSEAANLIRKVIPVEDASLKTEESSPPAAETPRMERTSLAEHTVAEGDMLSSLALRYYGRADLWPLIHKANRAIIGDNPGTIFPGQTLEIPTLESAVEPPSVVLETAIPPLALKSEPVAAPVQNSSDAAAQPKETPAEPAPGSSGIETVHEKPSAPETTQEMASENVVATAPALSENQTRLENLDADTALTSAELGESAEELTGEKLASTNMRTMVGWGDLIWVIGSVGSRAGGAVPNISLGGDTHTDNDEDNESSGTADSGEIPQNVLPADIIPIEMIQDDYHPPVGDISEGEIGEVPALPVSAIPIEMIIDEEDRQSSGDSDYNSYDTRPEIPPPDEVLDDGTRVWHDGSRPDFEGGDMRIRPDGTFEIEF